MPVEAEVLDRSVVIEVVPLIRTHEEERGHDEPDDDVEPVQAGRHVVDRRLNRRPVGVLRQRDADVVNLVVPLPGLDAEERQPEQYRRADTGHEPLATPASGSHQRENDGERRGQEHERVDQPRQRGGECLPAPPAGVDPDEDGRRNERPEHQDVGGEEEPHPEFGLLDAVERPPVRDGRRRGVEVLEPPLDAGVQERDDPDDGKQRVDDRSLERDADAGDRRPGIDRQ